MDSVKLIFEVELPAELVERAKAAGVDFEKLRVEELLEAEIRRREAGRRLLEIAEQLEGSLTEEEIETELAAAKAERISRAEAAKQ